MVKRYIIIGFRVEESLKELIDKIARVQGITVSEYLRKLVIEDLDKRNIFTSRLKEEMIKSE